LPPLALSEDAHMFGLNEQALVYFSSPWENCLALWQYFKIILFQIADKTNLTWPYLTLTNLNIPFPNPAWGHQMPLSEAL